MGSITPIRPGTNWAGNHVYHAGDLYQPETVAEIQSLVSKLARVKAVGSRHCFNDVADSPVAQISTERLNHFAIDEEAMTVTIGSGMRYGQFCHDLDKQGYALHNLASLPHISVAGACATATHGSGVKNGNLGTSVSGVEFVSGTGELITLTRHKDRELLDGAVVNLGGLGVITKVTLDIEKAFSVSQNVFQKLAFEQLQDHFDEIVSSGYSVSLFTNWQDRTIDQIWIKRRTEEDLKDLPAEFFGATVAVEDLHPIAGISAENCTGQMGIVGKWYDRLPHFKMGFTPSSGAELQSEYFVPRRNTIDAILALEKKRDLIGPHLLISEIRTIASDDLWLSPCYKQDCVAIHFTWKPDAAAIGELLPIIEAELSPYRARPHWGKLFNTSPEVLLSLYEKLPDFIGLLSSYDPQGKFRNSFMDKYIFDSS
jgi:alditol oxidase